MSEKNIIKLNKEDVQYRIKTSRRSRRLRISVHCDTGLVVTMPRGMTQSVMEDFLRTKAGWILKKIQYFKQFVNLPSGKYGRSDYLAKKESARALILTRINHLNQFYDFKFNRVFIKNHKSVWGSCSKKGNLNFNYKLIYLESILIDYVVVHELCHLKEFNHSQNFWRLVSVVIPNFKNLRKELKNKSMELR